MPRMHLRRDRTSAVALMFAIMAVPIVGLVGLAIDFGFWNQTYSSLSLAASGAALNAVKVAATGEKADEPYAAYEAAGIAAARAWFAAQVARNAGAVPGLGTDLAVQISQATTANPTITARVKYSGTILPVFGGLFHLTSYPVDVAAESTIAIAPFLDVIMLLDDSPSMDIAASRDDQLRMMQSVPCSPIGQAFSNSYDMYQYDESANGGEHYPAGYLPFPLPQPTPPVLTTKGPFPIVQAGAKRLPVCAANGNPAGPPCAFACHYSSSGGDLYSFAHSQTPPIPVRFDVLTKAVQSVLQQMQTDDINASLAVGIYTFDTDFNRLYPPSGEAGTDFGTAVSDIAKATPMLSVSPNYSGDITGDTDPADSIRHLVSQVLTASGNGLTVDTPRKVVFLVTDGMIDYTPAGSSRLFGPIQSSYCDQFKSLGYEVYVLYTPFLPLEENQYLLSPAIYTAAQPTAAGPSPIQQNLQSCSSDPQYDFAVATDGTEANISAALKKFLSRATVSTVAKYIE